MLAEAGLKGVSSKNHWPQEKKAVFSDLAFASTWPMVVSSPGVPVASPQTMILGSVNFPS